MEFIGKWLNEQQRIYLIEIRGYLKLEEADPPFLAIIEGEAGAIPAYLILDLTGAMIPDMLVQPTTWSLETDYSIRVKRFLSRPDVRFLIHIMNNNSAYFERTQEYYEFLDMSHKIHFLPTVNEALEFILGVSH
jgi:hypothetical protein